MTPWNKCPYSLLTDCILIMNKDWKRIYFCLKVWNQGGQVRTLCRQNESNFAYFWLALTSIFGLCFMPVCLIKSNCYSLIYSSLGLIISFMLLWFLASQIWFHLASGHIAALQYFLGGKNYPLQCFIISSQLWRSLQTQHAITT